MDAETSQVALGVTRSKEVRQESPQDPQENTALKEPVVLTLNSQPSEV